MVLLNTNRSEDDDYLSERDPEYIICGLSKIFFFSSRRRHTRLQGDWSSDVCSSDLAQGGGRLEPYGARVMFSTPPATNTSPSPALIAWAALAAACNPEPHSRFTVWPGTSTGRPATSDAMRATLRLSSPAWLVHPRITSSMLAGSMPERSTTALIGIAARSSARTPARLPPCLA